MGLALVFAHLIARRVRRVVAGLERLSEGEFGHRLQVEGRDELAGLATSINELAERLEAARLSAAMGRLDRNEFLHTTGEMAEWARFASGLAHEMADPLNAAALHLGHLKRRWQDPAPEAARHLQVLEQELKHLEQIIVGFRRFAMLGEMRARWFDPTEVLSGMADRAAEVLGEKRSRLHVEAAGLPRQFWGDPILIQQALVNLVANADQAMPEGGDITLAATAGGETLDLEVLDRGVGVPEAIRDRIFDPYFTTRSEGSGIGLSVVLQVARLHGGDVRVSARTGGGTRVRLRLPVRRVEAAVDRALAAAPCLVPFALAPAVLAALLLSSCAAFSRAPATAPANAGGTTTPAPAGGTATRPAPAAPDTAVAERIKVEGVLDDAEKQRLLEAVTADTTEAGAAVRRCLNGHPKEGQQGSIESALSLLSETRDALERGELLRAEPLARKARQLAESLACS
jgi:signal transduction histidine kinase